MNVIYLKLWIVYVKLNELHKSSFDPLRSKSEQADEKWPQKCHEQTTD